MKSIFFIILCYFILLVKKSEKELFENNEISNVKVAVVHGN